MPRDVCVQVYRNKLRRERKKLEARLQYCEADEIVRDRKTESMRKSREKRLLATFEIQRLALENSLPFFESEELQMQELGCFAVFDPETQKSKPCSSKLEAYIELKAKAKDFLLVYYPGKDTVQLTTYTEDATSKPMIFAQERLDVYSIFFPPVAILSSRLAIPSTEPCEACGLSGKGSKHLYGGACSKAFTTF